MMILKEKDDKLTSLESRLRLLEAEEGRIEELEDIIRHNKIEIQEIELKLSEAIDWRTNHEESFSKQTLRMQEIETIMSRLRSEKEESENKFYECDLRATRLQGELVSNRKALRQAVTQLQQIETEHLQSQSLINMGRKTGNSGGGSGGSGNNSPSNSDIANTQLLLNQLPGGISSSNATSSNASLSVGDRVSRIRDRMVALLNLVGTQHNELTALRRKVDDLEQGIERSTTAYALLSSQQTSSSSSSSSPSSSPSPSPQTLSSSPPPPPSPMSISNSSTPNTPTTSVQINNRKAESSSSVSKQNTPSQMTTPNSSTSTSTPSSSNRLSSRGGIGSNQPKDRIEKKVQELTHLKCAVLELILSNPEDCAKRQQLTNLVARSLHFTKRETDAALAVANRTPDDTDPLAFLGGLLG
eukprot:CAMPEP_0114360834 /NCGR_PEP_ID=MMETSP0101-20121206/24170_1 /TAXON_ID=38822 ORGANISM="Pteridomonas danica, Strain PT" /NCGR_SAMPLE_ID=MMETSP0101 /ASSEMBLY_ACC=CAM_ASM_000211 /LENGTH=413 /DNA_ID=CAMNT_0001505287 /DNA_START=1 /DNA_END=1242 /DNA_ORIENTATION=-